jgi:ketosteroid isomerase-like protein
MQPDATTQELVDRFVAGRASGDADALGATLAPDVAWFPPPGASLGPFHGRDAVLDGLLGGAAGRFLDLDTVVREVRKTVVEGDTGVILQQLRAKTHDGGDYANEYCWVLTCAGGAVVRIDEYADTLYAARTFGLL